MRTPESRTLPPVAGSTHRYDLLADALAGRVEVFGDYLERHGHVDALLAMAAVGSLCALAVQIVASGEVPAVEVTPDLRIVRWAHARTIPDWQETLRDAVTMAQPLGLPHDADWKLAASRACYAIACLADHRAQRSHLN